MDPLGWGDIDNETENLLSIERFRSCCVLMLGLNMSSWHALPSFELAILPAKGIKCMDCSSSNRLHFFVFFCGLTWEPFNLQVVALKIGAWAKYYYHQTILTLKDWSATRFTEISASKSVWIQFYDVIFKIYPVILSFSRCPCLRLFSIFFRYRDPMGRRGFS